MINEYLNKFRNWYLTYYTEITWFLIGWLIMAAMDALSKGQYVTALVDIILAGANYAFSKRPPQ